MFSHRINTAQGVAEWRLCLGCGACAYICPDHKVSLVDVLAEGIRPVVSDRSCGDCRDCLLVCPVLANDHRDLRRRTGIDPSLFVDFGPVLEIWEGHAGDEEIRYRGSSGGAITALALYCLDAARMSGVLHLQADPDDPLRNRTHLSRTRAELLAGAGSRYAPGAVCEGLDAIETAPAPCVFVGQPCEVTALRKAQQLRPILRENVGLCISFCCAGSPPTEATLQLLRGLNVDPEDVGEIRYRGLGWPGSFAVRRRNETELRPLLTYQDSWGALQRFRPYGIHLFPDLSGEDADISCADAWNRPAGEREGSGYSILIVRTERGRKLLHDALDARALVARRVDPGRLVQAQRSLVGKRGVFWGRILIFRLLGMPAPKLKGFDAALAWWRLPLKGKVKSTLGTLRRVLQRRYYRRLRFHRDGCVPRRPNLQYGNGRNS